MYPPSSAENGRLLGVGPLARRAEDLIAVLAIVAGPDGVDAKSGKSRWVTRSRSRSRGCA